MTSRTRSLSRTLIAVTAATAPVVALAPTAHAAPSPQVPRAPQGLQPAVPTLPATPARVLPTVEHNSVTRWVSVPVANVRSGPSTSYKVVGTKTQGTAVRGTVTSNGWLKISSTQYMAPSVVTSTDPGSATASSSSSQSVTMYMSASVGNVRSGPGLDHRVVGTMTKGAQVKGTWTSNGWLRVGSDRYVSGTILDPASDPASSASSEGGSTAPQTSQTVTRWVSVPAANVRRGPSTSQPVVGTKTAGAEVRGTLSSNGWLKISETQYMAPSVLTSTRPAGSSSPETSTPVTQYLTAAVGNVRSGPGLNHAVVGTMTLGTKVTGTWASNNWLDLGDGRFVSGLILSSSNPAPAPAAPPAAQVVDRWVSVPVANVRSGPATSYSVVGTATQGTKVTGELTSNGWLKMSSSRYLAPSVLSATAPATSPSPSPAPAPAPPATTPLRQALLNTAAQYVGYPYVLYGTPPEAFDCSAYTWWVYKQNGINIPRTVRDQRTFVTPVTDPQPGDLIFYKNWYHVGIYAGDGMSYEAMNPDVDVRYGKLWESPEDVWYGRVPGL